MWTRRIAALNASSPAYSHGRLFVSNLDPGQVVALDAKTGKMLWKRALPGRTESSPVVVGNKVFLGCECGSLYALNAKTGGVEWSTDLGGEIKAAPAYDKGHLYVGTYGGGMYSVTATNGDVQWSASGLDSGLGGVGNFYATPAVAFGRIYVGNTDSRIYSFDEDTGEVAWTYSTGGYVYSGAAVADTKHSAPTVYFGSYDGNAYALNAQNGDVRWTQDMGGRVIGSVVVIGETVYVSEFDDTTIYGFRLRDGKKNFSYHTGAYMPAITDGRRLYLVGYSSIHALDPVKPGQQHQGGSGGGQQNGHQRQGAGGGQN
jgi:outer membrane protein assembly factor BamB